MACQLQEKISLVCFVVLLLVIFIYIEDPIDTYTIPKPKPAPRFAYKSSEIKFGGSISAGDELEESSKVEYRQSSHSEVIKDREETSEVVTNKNDNYFKFTNNSVVRLWIDVPNAFPWRKCLFRYSNHMYTYDCKKGVSVEQDVTVMVVDGSSAEVRLLLAGSCIQPDSEGSVVLVEPGQCEGSWRWSRTTGLLRYQDRGCLASLGGQDKTVVAACDPDREEQMLEVGLRTEDGKIAPIDPNNWRLRMDLARERELDLAKIEVDKVMADIQELNRTDALYEISGSRRAVVFYVDKGSGFLAYLTWWLYTWAKIGLDSEKEAFDIVLLTHPKSVSKLPSDCHVIEDSFDPGLAVGPGRCLYKPLVPLSERNYKYDNYLNSQECLFNPAAAFLLSYRVLIRADLDTFPTPAMLGYWPTDIICNRNAGTTHNRKDIESAIVATAEAAGVRHRGWHNTDSAWMGPSMRVVQLSRLTTFLARFTRAHMFGPGTVCRCPTCTELPTECQWGTGIYAGTLLLYAQEIAMNAMWTQREYDRMKYAVLDGSCTDEKINVCTPALLHARHNSEPFSKFAFLRGDYKQRELSGLDLSNVRDYAIFMAVSSAGQGSGTDTAWQGFRNKYNGTELGQLCTEGHLKPPQ